MAIIGAERPTSPEYPLPDHPFMAKLRGNPKAIAPNIVEAEVPFDIIRPEDELVVEGDHVDELMVKLPRDGQLSRVVLAEVSGFDQTLTVDGLHRTTAGLLNAKKGIPISEVPLGYIRGTIRFGSTLNYVLQERIDASVDHGDIKYNRFMWLVIANWPFTGIADLVSPQEGFKLLYPPTNVDRPRTKRKLTDAEYAKVVATTSAIANRWKVDTNLIKRWVRVGSHADPRLSLKVRDREGEHILKAITFQHLEAIVKYLPDRFPLQHFVADMAVAKSLTVAATRDLAERVRDLGNPNPTAEDLERPKLVVVTSNPVTPVPSPETNGHRRNGQPPAAETNSTVRPDQTQARLQIIEAELKRTGQELAQVTIERDQLLSKGQAAVEDKTRAIELQYVSQLTSLSAENERITSANTQLQGQVDQLAGQLSEERRAKAQLEAEKTDLIEANSLLASRAVEQDKKLAAQRENNRQLTVDNELTKLKLREKDELIAQLQEELDTKQRSAPPAEPVITTSPAPPVVETTEEPTPAITPDISTEIVTYEQRVDQAYEATIFPDLANEDLVLELELCNAAKLNSLTPALEKAGDKPIPRSVPNLIRHALRLSGSGVRTNFGDYNPSALDSLSASIIYQDIQAILDLMNQNPDLPNLLEVTKHTIGRYLKIGKS